MNDAEADWLLGYDAKTLQHRPPKLQDTLDDLLGSFPDQELLSVEQGDHRVRRLLNELNQVGIDREQL
jgi:hypothetical protein